MRPTTFAEALEVLIALRDETAAVSANKQSEFLHFCVANILRSRSQFLQDLWVAYELGSRTNGFFVEFGGADGVKGSNSYFLERDLGWNGIVAEPARIWQAALKVNRNCFVDDRCVWTTSGETLTFNQPPIAAHSTIDTYSDSDMHAHTRKDGERYPVSTVSLADLLAHWSAPRRIDYLSIDTEGSEFDILQSFDFSAYDIRLITVEHNHTDKRQALFDLLAAKGYQRRFETLSNVDDWYVKVY
jgi:FkbM family methyltransferase